MTSIKSPNSLTSLDEKLRLLRTPEPPYYVVISSNIHYGTNYDLYEQLLDETFDEANKAHVKRFLYIGSITVGKEPKQFIDELKSFYQLNNEPVPDELLANTQTISYYNYVKVKEMAEKHIINSGINYTILRAGLLTQEQGSGKINLTEGTINAFGKTSRDNIAAAFIEALENENTYKKIYTVINGGVPIAKAFT